MGQPFNRREFLAGTAGMGAFQSRSPRSVFIFSDPADPIASARPVQWAIEQLQQALTTHGIEAGRDDAEAAFRIEVAGAASSLALSRFPAFPSTPETAGLAPGSRAPGVLACGSDARGLVYAVLELADRVQHSTDPLSALAVRKPLIEQPANKIRSITRCFVSDVEDKPWFNDRDMWPEYLSMLAAQRFNRFSLAFGIGYDFLREITDCYLHFAYPFLVDVPGYRVRARGLPDAERDRNLEMLRFIGEQTAARGLDFQLALWTHGYRWTDSPKANYVIDGLTPENHAAYCRDALQTVLEACPAIRGVTFRIHGESGVPEGDYGFWKTVFEGITRTGRRIEIDMHAKGMDYGMIDVALATGMPVNVSPKYWAEHMGLPYHQAGIRDLEKPPKARQDQGFFALSGGSRRFLRYGYGDLLREDRRHGVLHRMWPGTQRMLLWGDPAMAAAYGRASSFCGSAGVELCEPLSFKGRKGSGLPGGRCGYADRALNPRWDWQKFLYTYRVWGRLLYNPDSDPGVWRRFLAKELGPSAAAGEAALANASRILPLVTTAHGASGANNSYWPEIYSNMATVNTGKPQPYSDTPTPRKFGTVSPFDPVLFSPVDDFAAELLAGRPSARYSPIEVAQWLEGFGGAARKHLGEARGGTGAGFRRLSVDVLIEAGLGSFFAAKFRSAVLYNIFERTGDREALEQALKLYRSARAAWVELAGHARDVYLPDLTYGYVKQLRGHWLDRLPAIDEDLADMERQLGSAKSAGSNEVKRAIAAALGRPDRASVACRHSPAAGFRPGEPLLIRLELDRPLPVRIHYRHVDQAEEFETADMTGPGRRRRFSIPGSYTQSPFPLQYFFEIQDGARQPGLYPGLHPPEWGQPYFAVRQAHI